MMDKTFHDMTLHDKTFCIFGDSIIQAAYVKESWIDLLRLHLEEKYRNDFINVFNLGIGGNTSGDVLTRLKAESEARNPTTFIFQVGVNDSGYLKTVNNLITEEGEFKLNLEGIIKLAKEFTQDIYFVGLAIGDDSILKPFPGSTSGKSYDSQRVKKYDEILKQVAIDAGCKYIPLWNKLGTNDFMDGLHPNDSGHKKIFQELKQFF